MEPAAGATHPDSALSPATQCKPAIPALGSRDKCSLGSPRPCLNNEVCSCPWRRGQQLHACLAWQRGSSAQHGVARRFANAELKQGHPICSSSSHESPRPTLSPLSPSEVPKVTWKQPSHLSPASPRPPPTDSLRKAPREKTSDSESRTSAAARQRCQRGDRSPLQQAHGRHGYTGHGRKWGGLREPGGTIHQ